MTKWVSVKYAVPPDDREVLIAYEYEYEKKYPINITIGRRCVYKNGKVKWKYLSCFGQSVLCTEGEKSFGKILSWMPLPDAPEIQSTELKEVK